MVGLNRFSLFGPGLCSRLPRPLLEGTLASAERLRRVDNPEDYRV